VVQGVFVIPDPSVLATKNTRQRSGTPVGLTTASRRLLAAGPSICSQILPAVPYRQLKCSAILTPLTAGHSGNSCHPRAGSVHRRLQFPVRRRPSGRTRESQENAFSTRIGERALRPATGLVNRSQTTQRALSQLIDTVRAHMPEFDLTSGSIPTTTSRKLPAVDRARDGGGGGGGNVEHRQCGSSTSALDGFSTPTRAEHRRYHSDRP